MKHGKRRRLANVAEQARRVVFKTKEAELSVFYTTSGEERDPQGRSRTLRLRAAGGRVGGDDCTISTKKLPPLRAGDFVITLLNDFRR